MIMEYVSGGELFEFIVKNGRVRASSFFSVGPWPLFSRPTNFHMGSNNASFCLASWCSWVRTTHGTIFSRLSVRWSIVTATKSCTVTWSLRTCCLTWARKMWKLQTLDSPTSWRTGSSSKHHVAPRTMPHLRSFLESQWNHLFWWLCDNEKTKTTTPIPLSVCMLEQKWTSGAVEWFCMRCCVDGCPLMTSISRPCSRKSRVLFPFPFRKCRKCEMNPLPTLRLQGGIFTIPNWVSPSARDLLYAMLAVDPIKRMSIPEIRFHILIILFLIFIPPCAVIHVLSLLWLSSESEWFNHNLPAYLKPLPEANQGIFSEPNPTVIYEVSEVGSFVSLTFSKPGISSHQVNPPCCRDWDWIPTKYQLHCWKKETMKLRWPTISSLTTMQSTSSVKHSPLSSWPDNYGTWFLTSSFLFFIPKQR